MPRHLLVLWSALLFAQFLPAQIGYSFDSLVAETGQCMSLYGETQEYDQEAPVYGWQDKLSSQLQIDLWNYLGSEDIVRTDSTGIKGYALIGFLQERIMFNLFLLTRHPDFGEHDIQELSFPGLGIAHSEDKKLFSFSIEEKGGGTYRSRLSLLYFSDAENPPRPEAPEALLDNSLYPDFHRDGYSEIHMLGPEEDRSYLLLGWVQGCGSCFHSYAKLVRQGKEDLDIVFELDLELRNWETAVEYDPKTQTIRVHYKTDDMSPLCPGETEAEFSEEDMEWGRPCECTFVFDGNTFVPTVQNTEDR